MNLTESIELYQRAMKIIPGGSQTNSKRAAAYALGAYPIYAQRGEGSHLWDVDGNEYIDYVNALGPITLGYRYPAVDKAIQEQLRKGIIYGLLDPLEVEAAEAVIDAVPCAEMVRFLKSGAEVTSAALRIARGYTKREKVISCGYHGWHDNWTAQNNDGGVPKILSDLIYGFSYNDLDSLEKSLKENHGEIAAIIMIATQTELPKPGFLEGVRGLADEHGAVVIYDEIVTGFRLARGGAQEYFGVTPDLACFAKGIANGMPLAAVVGKSEIMRCAEKLTITTTYGGEALSLAAVAAALREYIEKDVFGTIWGRGERLMEGLNDAAEKRGFKPVCYGLAPMSGLDISYGDTKPNDDIWFFFLQECAMRGVLFRRGGLNFITYSHSDEDIEKTIGVVDEVLGEMKDTIDKGDLASRLGRLESHA